MPKEELTTEKKIEQAITALSNALLENVRASEAETAIAVRRKKAHYALLEAEEYFNSLKMELIAL